MKQFTKTMSAVILLATITFIGCKEDSIWAPAFTTYKVTFDLSGGTTGEVAEKTIEEGNLVAKPSKDPIKTGETFAGWYKNVEKTLLFDFNMPITANTVVYAKFTVNAFTINFNIDGVTANSIVVSPNDKIAAPIAPTKVGHAFEGWYTDNTFTTKFDFTLPISTNINLYANFLAWSAESIFKTSTVGLPAGEIGIIEFNSIDAENIVVPETIDGKKVVSIGGKIISSANTKTKIVLLPVAGFIKTIKERALSSCVALTSINIPNSVTNIEQFAFVGCQSLTAIKIPDAMTSINESTFANCTALKTVNIPDGVVTIGNKAFFYCESFTAIKIPDGVTSIGSSAFGGCKGLTTINIPNNVTSIGSNAFQACRGATSITIGTGISTIESAVFSSCTSLKTITIPNNVTTIKSDAFSYNTLLATINIPNSVTTIGDYALRQCDFTSIEIPSSVTNIGNGVFYYCLKLTEVKMMPTSVPTLGNIYAFDKTHATLKIKVPTASLVAYQTATNWSTYVDKIDVQ